MIFVHVLRQRVAKDERETALLTFVTLSRFVQCQMGKVFDGGSPRGTLVTSRVHLETLKAERAKGPVDVVVPLDEVVDHHVVDTGFERADGTNVWHFVAHVVTPHMLNHFYVAVVIALANFASATDQGETGLTIP